MKGLKISNGTLCLCHSQRKGARWGERHFQSYDVTGIPKRGRGVEYGQAAAQTERIAEAKADKKGLVEGIKDLMEKRAEVKARKKNLDEDRKTADAEKAKQDEVDEKRRAEELKKEFEENKDDVIKSGDPEKVLKYAGMYTDSELRSAIANIEQYRKLKDMKNDKTNIIQSGDPRKILKYGDRFSANELNDAIRIAEYKSKLKNLANPPIKTGLELLKENTELMDTSVKAVKIAIDGYNQFAKIVNTFSEYDFKLISDKK